ncbi:MAG TPA: redoxin domain-containing protein [Bradyrhizobium sp.]
MSKKTRKKSPKTPARKTARAKPATSAKRSPSKTRPAGPSKPRTNATKQSGNAGAEASHKAPSKRLTKASPKASALTEGALAPAFSLPRDGGDTVSLSDYAGQKLVLFFYPRADTPGCTREAIDFTRLAAAFGESDTAVLGVSADAPKQQEAFRNKHKLAVPLASDEKHLVLEAYGVWGEKSMYGKIFQGILRTTVLVGKDGRIMRIWRNVRVDGHADEVLAAARAV